LSGHVENSEDLKGLHLPDGTSVAHSIQFVIAERIGDRQRDQIQGQMPDVTLPFGSNNPSPPNSFVGNVGSFLHPGNMLLDQEVVQQISLYFQNLIEHLAVVVDRSCSD
jgi:hypothetical protein